MDAYLSRGMDAVELTAITVEYMLRENYSGDDILDFLTQESKYYKRDVDKSFTGIYGLFNGEYLDGIGWQPEKDYVPQDESGIKRLLPQTASLHLYSRILMSRQGLLWFR